jgi:glycosyltransferase involved in cell wall biosynthesis
MLSSRRKIFIHATNVHVGGGRSLLHALLQSLPTDLCIVALLDTRMKMPDKVVQNLEIKRVNPSVWQRLKAEWWLTENVGLDDVILCFGNLPPLFRLRGRVLVFVQNRYLVDRIDLKGFPIKTRLRLNIERLWFYCKAGNAQAFIVQTPSMQTILESLSKVGTTPIYVLPFVNTSQGYKRVLEQPGPDQVTNDFIYVASGEVHKNHRRLIEAWCLLAQDGLFPSLWLTLNAKAHPDLCVWIDKMKAQWGLHLENLGIQPQEKILQLYAEVRALIYPSTFESFGLPLIEARQAGLAVVASELDFVRDVLDPDQSFDPGSPTSIARAVKRFLDVDERPLPLLDAKSFLDQIFRKIG